MKTNFKSSEFDRLIECLDSNLESMNKKREVLLGQVAARRAEHNSKNWFVRLFSIGPDDLLRSTESPMWNLNMTNSWIDETRALRSRICKAASKNADSMFCLNTNSGVCKWTTQNSVKIVNAPISLHMVNCVVTHLKRCV